MKFVKWAEPVTYSASRFEVMTDEHHARSVAIAENLDDARKISATPELIAALKFTLECVELSTEFKIGNPAYERASALARAALTKSGA